MIKSVIKSRKLFGLLMVALLFGGILLGLGEMKPASAAANQNYLGNGEVLHAGEALISPNGLYSLEMQHDANLVIYGPGRSFVWASNTGGHGDGAVLVNQGDNNLVLIDNRGVPLWESYTNEPNPANYYKSTLWMQDDGNLVLYFNYNRNPWATNTAQTLTTAQQLAQQILNNPRINKSGRLVLQDLQNAAAGRPSSSGAYLKASILQVILTVAQSHTVTISAIESGGTGHSTGSNHYYGSAVDFSQLDGVSLSGRDSRSVTIINLVKNNLPYGSGFGQSNCGKTPALPAGVTTFSDTCNHLHIQVPK